MSIKAVLFDIGGVLEITPHRGTTAMWEQRLGLSVGEIGRRLGDVWRAGSVGSMTERQAHDRIRTSLDLDDRQLSDYIADIWREYLGTLNVELAAYFRRLNERCLTGIISNSFVGARKQEEAAYRFSELTTSIVYSHEVGIQKPDPRIYQLACKQLGVHPSECIFLDDVQAAVDGARAVGMHGVLYRDNAQAIAQIEALLASD